MIPDSGDAAGPTEAFRDCAGVVLSCTASTVRAPM